MTCNEQPATGLRLPQRRKGRGGVAATVLLRQGCGESSAALQDEACGRRELAEEAYFLRLSLAGAFQIASEGEGFKQANMPKKLELMNA